MKLALRILFLLLVFGKCEAQSSTPTPSLSMCLQQPGNLLNLVGWQIYLDGVILTNVPLANATKTFFPGQDCSTFPCYCFPLPWFITNPDQQQLFVTACNGGFNQSCSNLSNEWPTRTPSPTSTITNTPTPFFTQTPLPTNTSIATNTPLNTQTPLPTNTLAPANTPTVTLTVTQTPLPTPHKPILICVGPLCEVIP